MQPARMLARAESSPSDPQSRTYPTKCPTCLHTARLTPKRSPSPFDGDMPSSVCA